MTFDAGSTPDPIAVGAPLNAIDFPGGCSAEVNRQKYLILVQDIGLHDS
jgi:hypothetical protein